MIVNSYLYLYLSLTYLPKNMYWPSYVLSEHAYKALLEISKHSRCSIIQTMGPDRAMFILTLSSPVYQVEMLCFALICICDSAKP